MTRSVRASQGTWSMVFGFDLLGSLEQAASQASPSPCVCAGREHFCARRSTRAHCSTE
jgi:hypothetical protein